MQYLLCILQISHSTNMSIRSQRELRTLAEALDMLLTGQLAQLGDLLMQRFKAVEVAAVDGWAIAKHLELIPSAGLSSISNMERKLATDMEMREMKLHELTKKTQGQSKF